MMFNSSALYIVHLSNGQTKNRWEMTLKIYPIVFGLWEILFSVRDVTQELQF